jgi:ABC-type transport system substrate-binding protein
LKAPIAALFVIVATSSLLDAETRPRYAGRVDGSLLGAPATLDPVTARSHAELTVTGMIFDTLYRVELGGNGGVVHPRLAASAPELDNSKLVARVAIRKGVKFHDGTTLNVTDVAASLDRARTGGGKWALAPIVSVKTDGDAIELTLRTQVDVATMLSLAPTAITKQGRSPGTKPVGTGPFTLDSLDRRGKKLVLAAFEDHFAGRTYLDRVTLHWSDKADAEAKRFETDGAQLSARGVAAFTGGQPKYKAGAVDGPKALLVYVGFGKKHADVLREPAFRRALDLALDRNGLVSVNRGEAVMPAAEPLPVEAGARLPSQLVRTGDLGRARTELANAAKRVPSLNPTRASQLTLEISFEDTRPDDREIAERVARALGKLGIGATLSAVSAVELRDRILRGTTDLYLGQLAAPLPIAWAWWSAAFAAGGDDWAIQRLASGGLTTEAARNQFAVRRPIVPLMFRGVRMWHRADLRGLRFDATGRPCLEELFVFGTPVKSGSP